MLLHPWDIWDGCYRQWWRQPHSIGILYWGKQGRRGLFWASWCEGSLCTQHGLWWAAVRLCQPAKPLWYIIHLDAEVTLKAEPEGQVNLHIQEEEGSLLSSVAGAWGSGEGQCTAVRFLCNSDTPGCDISQRLPECIWHRSPNPPVEMPGHHGTKCPQV